MSHDVESLRQRILVEAALSSVPASGSGDDLFRAIVAGAAVSPGLRSQLFSRDTRWNLDPAYATRWPQSARQWVVHALRTVTRPFVRSYHDRLTNRQAQLNLVLLQAVRDLCDEVARLKAAQAGG